MTPATVPFRMRVLAVVDNAKRPLAGIEVARAVGAPYKPTIDALNALLNHGKVQRQGRKFTARWLPSPKVTAPEHHHLHLAWMAMKGKTP